ncbi:hypothetical protein [Flectobacillus longus]|uniref:hypothetical protein n=1 Tax=Flectobacillus longus TaxID=2984207 RepID=UPI0024B7D121|nr:hypothetical protein [Flectobacillus longus]MDI9882677.1 hypothetical protein [Flectobacillus longus]
MNFKVIFKIMGMVLFSPFLYAHSPDLSSLMIYEENGKTFLVIKSSIAAFEGEVVYLYGKESYKTPQEFSELAIEYFKENCFVAINNKTIKFINPQIQLGHETTLFAELQHIPKNINSIHVKNTLFKDMPNNLCELILILKGLPQKQYILNNKSRHEVNLKLEKNKWSIEERSNANVTSNKFILIGSIISFIFVTIVFTQRKSIS